MKKFIVIYYDAPQSAVQNMQSTSPEDTKGVMDAWMAWAKRCGSAMVDLGTPLGNGQRVSKAGSSRSNSNIIGYTILQAESMEKAKALLQGHPHLEMPGGCEIEVHESLPLPM